MPPMPAISILVAGVGNLFLRDDGWGCEVVRRLAAEPLPEGVRAVDFGVGGVHLAYELLEGVDLLVLVDVIGRGVAPGTVSLVEVDPDALPGAQIDSHAMDPGAVLANVRALGGIPPPTLLVGCEPADLGEGIGLSPATEAAVEPALRMLRDVLWRPSVVGGTDVTVDVGGADVTADVGGTDVTADAINDPEMT